MRTDTTQPAPPVLRRCVVGWLVWGNNQPLKICSILIDRELLERGRIYELEVCLFRSWMQTSFRFPGPATAARSRIRVDAMNPKRFLLVCSVALAFSGVLGCSAVQPPIKVLRISIPPASSPWQKWFVHSTRASSLYPARPHRSLAAGPPQVILQVYVPRWAAGPGSGALSCVSMPRPL